MVLRLRVAERDPEQTDLWKSVVNGPIQAWRDRGYTVRVMPGHPEQSAVLARMMSRQLHDQMPPLATEFVDTQGVALITRWVTSLVP
jgi:hypothetical protein